MSTTAHWLLAALIAGTALVVIVLVWRFILQDGQPPGYHGHSPEIPDGWEELPQGAHIREFDKVWGFTGWFPVPMIPYQVQEGDLFIRSSNAVPTTDPFFRAAGRWPGRKGRVERDGYDSIA